MTISRIYVSIFQAAFRSKDIFYRHQKPYAQIANILRLQEDNRTMFEFYALPHPYLPPLRPVHNLLGRVREAGEFDNAIRIFCLDDVPKLLDEVRAI
jgi:hypothetical protein